MGKAEAISLQQSLEGLTRLPDRRPDTPGLGSACRMLSGYRDGGIFLASFAGRSEWERHPNGDEIVYVVGGEATLVLMIEGSEIRNELRAGDFLVVPQNTWHRFETPNGVDVMTVTPQPTDHSIESPA